MRDYVSGCETIDEARCPKWTTRIYTTAPTGCKVTRATRNKQARHLGANTPDAMGGLCCEQAGSRRPAGCSPSKQLASMHASSSRESLLLPSRDHVRAPSTI